MELFPKKKLGFLIGGIVGLLLLMGGVFWYVNKSSKTVVNPLGELMTSTTESTFTTTSSSEVAESNTIFIDIKGGVVKPGVYEVPKNTRLHTLIEKAGGLKGEVEEKQINQAQVLQDETMIYIPLKGEEGVLPEASTSNETKEATTSNQEGKINLNTADITQLTTLPGIGEKKAAAIVSYREENGPFQKVEDLTEVAGIGEGTFTKLADLITIK